LSWFLVTPCEVLLSCLKLEDDPDTNLLDYVVGFKEKFTQASDMARQHLQDAQTKMKTWYDKAARDRVFQPGDKVLLLLPIPGQPLKARYFGPYSVHKKVGDTNYVVETPDRRKAKQFCHINMLKAYHDRNASTVPKVVCAVVAEKCESVPQTSDREIDDCVPN